MSSSSPVLGLGPGEKPRRKLTDELNSSDDEYDERVLRSSPFTSTLATGTTPVRVVGADVPDVATAAVTPNASSTASTPVARAAAIAAASEAVATSVARKRTAKTTNRFEAYEDVTDMIEFPCPDGRTFERREIDFDHKPIPVGSLVRVAKRTFPGCNKLGGVGKIAARNGTRENNDLTYDVAYVLGGAETGIHYAYVVLDGAFGTTTPRKRRALTTSGGDKKKKKTSTQSAKKKEKKRPAKAKAKVKRKRIIGVPRRFTDGLMIVTT